MTISSGKTILFVYFLLSSLCIQSQDFNGVITYQTKTTVDFDNVRGGQLSEQQKKQFAERLKSRLEKVYTLSFNKNESIYKEEEVLETQAQGGRGGRFGLFGGGFGQSNGIYKNIKDNVYLQETELSSKRFLIEDELPALEWTMENENKMIGDYVVFKATATRKRENFGFRGPRGRNGQGRQRNGNERDSLDTAERTGNVNPDIPNEETITVWYTPQIPIGQGPDDFWGLPGLILEANVGRTVILCTKIVLNTKEETTIKVPSKGKKVTRDEYAEIAKKQLEEARERFRGQRGRNGNGRRF